MQHAKLLLDENVSVSVAVALCADGIDACHVRDRGMLGVSDAGVLDRAFADDRNLVTVNVDDFVELAHQREIHAGMVLIEDGSLYRDEQLAVVRGALQIIGDQDMANRVLWVNLDGSMVFEEISPP